MVCPRCRVLSPGTWHGVEKDAPAGGDGCGDGDGAGSRRCRGVLQIACWTEGSGSQSGGLSLKLGNYNHRNEGLGDGHDELYVRYYVKFHEDYRAVRNHGANLGGRDVMRNDAAWVGMAGIRDVSTRGYFYSGVQPRGESGSRQLEIGFYSCHLDKKGPWGENYPVQKKILIEVGTWHCIQRHMKLNSVDPTRPDPAVADGIEELWIDGQLTIHKEGVRFRRAGHLRITFFSLETYYHGLPKNYDRAHPIRVYFDNVVVTDKKDRLGYGESFIVSPQGEMLARAELFRSELVTARITPAMFRHPYVWASLEEVPAWLNAELADQLRANGAPATGRER